MYLFVSYKNAVCIYGTVGERDLDQFLQQPKGTTTFNSFLKKRLESQFFGPPAKDPDSMTDANVRSLLGYASAKSVETVMNHHYFTIAGQIFK